MDLQKFLKVGFHVTGGGRGCQFAEKTVLCDGSGPLTGTVQMRDEGQILFAISASHGSTAESFGEQFIRVTITDASRYPTDIYKFLTA